MPYPTPSAPSSPSAFGHAFTFLWAVGALVVACSGGTTSGTFGANGGQGGGSALCGPNGTNRCPTGEQCSSTLGCVACLTDHDCPAAAPYCAKGACVLCNGSAGCASPMVCYPGSHTCHPPCTNNGSCGGRAPICDTATGACVGCMTATDCTGPNAQGNGTICDATTQQCIECLVNSDCPANAPRCLVGRGTCVACLSNADCGTAAPVCDSGTFRCRPGCTTDAQCAPPTSHCDAATSTCVQCNSSADCAGTSTPICADNHLCVACTMSSDCPSATPYCRPGGRFGFLAACVACLMSSQCPAAHPTCTAAGTCI